MIEETLHTHDFADLVGSPTPPLLHQSGDAQATTTDAWLTVMSVVLPKGLLLQNGSVRFTVTGRYVNPGWPRKTIEFRVSFGSTQITTATMTFGPPSAVPKRWRAVGELGCLDSATAQELDGSIHNEAAIAMRHQMLFGTAAEDTATQDQELLIEARLTPSGDNAELRVTRTLLEFLPSDS